ncbi:MAG: ShlB/FhaC/HecB family hemolysin secretion/activation protein [Rhizomicrobium sp.]
MARGGPIDFGVLTTGLNVLNRNPFRTVNVVLERSDEVGAADVALKVDERFPVRIYAAVDNTGVPVTGRDRYSIGVNWGNAFGFDQQFSYQFITSPDLWRTRDRGPGLSNDPRFLGHSVSYLAPLPWGDIVSLFGSYVAQVPDLGPDFGQVGHGVQFGARYQTPLWGGAAFSQQLQFGFDYKRADNNLAFGGVNIFASATNTEQFVLAYDATLNDAYGQTAVENTLYFSPGGLSDGNTTAAFAASGVNGAKAQYLYDNLRLTRLVFLPGHLSLVGRLDGQLASAELLPGEQLGAAASTACAATTSAPPTAARTFSPALNCAVRRSLRCAISPGSTTRARRWRSGTVAKSPIGICSRPAPLDRTAKRRRRLALQRRGVSSTCVSTMAGSSNVCRSPARGSAISPRSRSRWAIEPASRPNTERMRALRRCVSACRDRASPRVSVGKIRAAPNRRCLAAVHLGRLFRHGTQIELLDAGLRCPAVDVELGDQPGELGEKYRALRRGQRLQQLLVDDRKPVAHGVIKGPAGSGDVQRARLPVPGFAPDQSLVDELVHDGAHRLAVERDGAAKTALVDARKRVDDDQRHILKLGQVVLLCFMQEDGDADLIQAANQMAGMAEQLVLCAAPLAAADRVLWLGHLPSRIRRLVNLIVSRNGRKGNRSGRRTVFHIENDARLIRTCAGRPSGAGR